MDTVRYLNAKNQLWAKTSFGSCNDIPVSEIWYRGEARSQTEHRTIHRKSIRGWLANDYNSVTTKAQMPGLLVAKIVWINKDFAKNQFLPTADILYEILLAFGLNSAYTYSRTAFAGIASIPCHDADTAEILHAYSFCYHPKLTLIWSRHKTTNLIQAVCFSGEEQMSQFKQILDCGWQFADQDMMLAFLCSLLLSTEVDLTECAIKDEVRGVEARTGYHRWENRREHPAEGDLADLSAKISGCATKMASCTRKLKVIRELNSFIVDQIQDKPVVHSLLVPISPGISSSTTSKILLLENVKLVESRVTMQNIDTEFFLNRIESQLRAVSSQSINTSYSILSNTLFC